MQSTDSLLQYVLLLRSSAVLAKFPAEQPLFVTSQPKSDNYHFHQRLQTYQKQMDHRGDGFSDVSSVHKCHKMCVNTHAART